MSPYHSRTYALTLTGGLDDDFLAAYCPAGAILTRCGDSILLENLHTDQAGILGILRTLHNLGLIITQMNTCVERISQCVNVS
jgi:hypothetical protein